VYVALLINQIVMHNSNKIYPYAFTIPSTVLVLLLFFLLLMMLTMMLAYLKHFCSKWNSIQTVKF